MKADSKAVRRPEKASKAMRPQPLKTTVEKKLTEAAKKYIHGSIDDINIKGIEHKRLRQTMRETKANIQESAMRNATTEILLTANPGCIEMEGSRKVYSLKAKDIVTNADLNTAKSSMELQLTSFGPYSVDYSRNGR
jgi:U3 small nucleolar RNA-associated protein 7